MPDIIFNQTLLAGEIESTFRTMPTLDLMADVFDTGPVSINPDISQLQRNVRRATLSPVASRTGRRQMSYQFSLDMCGSGTTDASKAPDYGRFLRACGVAETQFASADVALARQSPENARQNVVPAAHGTDTYVGTVPRLTTITVTGSGVGTVNCHESPAGDAEVNATNVDISSGTAIAGPQGAQLMLTYTGSLTVGDKYFFVSVPPCHVYTPVSDQATMESIGLRCYVGNKYHDLTGGRGTFSLSARAGEYGVMNFTFTGDYVDPVDAAFPTAGSYSYGTNPTPPMVELADISSDGQQLACPTNYGVDLGGSVNARLCANGPGATAGAAFTARTPRMTFNMDAVPLATLDIWDQMKNGTQVQMTGYVGQQAGNTVMFLANGQYDNVQYAEENTLRKNDLSLALAGIAGDDELVLFIT